MTFTQALQLYQSGALEQGHAVALSGLKQNPNDGKLLQVLGLIETQRGQLDMAAHYYQQAIPKLLDALSTQINLSDVYRRQGRISEAIALLEPLHTQGLNPILLQKNLGILYSLNQQWDLAELMLTRVLAQNPAEAAVAYTLGVLYLTLGRYQEAWVLHEKRPSLKGVLAEHAAKLKWGAAQTVRGKTIKVVMEQGRGDALMLARFLALLRANHNTVIFECVPELQRLMQASACVDEVLPIGATAPKVDWVVPIMSLAFWWGCTLDQIPGPVPYIKIAKDPGHPAAALIGGQPGQVKWGLVWGGNPKQGKDRQRSASLKMLGPLLAIPAVQWFSLQCDNRKSELEQVSVATPLTDLSPYIDDYYDTAQALQCLDLVVSVDTSLAHLAGAMGRPVHIILSTQADWRWLLHGDTSPWYPNAKLWRQGSTGDWLGLAQRMARELA